MFKLYLARVKSAGYRGGAGILGNVVASAIESTRLETMETPYVELVTPDIRTGSPRVRRPRRGPKQCERGDIPPGSDLARVRTDREPKIALRGNLFPSVDAAALRRRTSRLWSYSALRRPHQAVAAVTEFAERPPRDDEDDSETIEEVGLLRGTVFGDLVHDVLERVDFTAVAAAAEPQALLAPGPERELLEDVFDRHAGGLPAGLASAKGREGGMLQVAQVVWAALRTPLPGLGGRLCDIPPRDRVHELEFHYHDRPAGRVAEAEEFLTGFMDMVFRKADRYFLLDWKTNDLHGDYSAEALARCMEGSDYARQYRLYAIALRRWLERRMPGFRFTRHFGGVYYLFVRGMTGQEASPGVFFHKPTDHELDPAGVFRPPAEERP